MFCGWYRIHDNGKVNAISWNVMDAIQQLLDHLDAVHYTAWHEFLNLAINFEAKNGKA